MALSKYVIDPEVLFDNKDLQERCLREREAMCAQQDVPVHKLAVTSLRTVVNALAIAYKATRKSDVFVPACSKQFPQWNAFMNDCVTRYNLNFPHLLNTTPIPLDTKHFKL